MIVIKEGFLESLESAEVLLRDAIRFFREEKFPDAEVSFRRLSSKINKISRKHIKGTGVLRDD